MYSIKKILALFFLSLGAIFAAQSSKASDFATTFILQTVLNNHGFSVGEPDGKIGPATRQGIKDFAEQYGTKNDYQSVLNFIVSQNYAARKIIENDEFLKKIEGEVAENLRDPSSVMIRNVFEVDIFICGEVNGKNAYGGYAGYTWFYGTKFLDNFSLLHIDNSNEAPIAMLRCTMTFPKK